MLRLPIAHGVVIDGLLQTAGQVGHLVGNPNFLKHRHGGWPRQTLLAVELQMLCLVLEICGLVLPLLLGGVFCVYSVNYV